MQAPTPEYSFSVDVTQLPAQGREYAISAKEAERKRVAARLALLDLPALEAKILVEPGLGGVVNVRGRLSADVVQQCVVTLGPLSAHIAEDFAVVFARPTLEDEDQELDLAPDAESPEILTGPEIDLGEIVVEQLALLLDPYPRAPGAVFETRTIGGDVGEKATVSPFAALAKLKTNNKNN